MELEHEFTVPVDVDAAWAVLLDIEQVAPCMPGAALDTVDGDDFTGSVKVKLGPISLTYKGKASFVEKDESAHRAVIDARGRDARGNGTANAKVTAALVPEGSSTKVTVSTDLDITGKPAQFGRGVMVDVGNKLIGQFADCLADKLTGGDGQDTSAATGSGSASGSASSPAPGSSSTPAPGPDDAAGPGASSIRTTASTSAASSGTGPAAGRPAGAAASPAPRAARHEPEAINLLDSAGPAVAKRLAPVAVAALVVLLVVRKRRSR